jgi:ParB family transcriptional regulator, chromosome partitioning protein
MNVKSKKSEPFQFGGVLEAFVTAQSETVSKDIQFLSIGSIVLPKNQPRRYFDPKKLEQLKHSIEQHGILEPLIVRPLEDDHYELVAGERRYRAACTLELFQVPVVVRCLNDEEAIQIALIENLQREDLNPVEETEAILHLLAFHLTLPVKEVPALLYRMQKETKGKVAHNVVGQTEIEAIERVFSSLGLMNWDSFVNHRLPLLKLPEEILEVLSQGKIAYTKAQAIARIKNDSERQAILKEAIEKNLSLNEVKQRIANLNLAGAETKLAADDDSYQDRLKFLSAKAKKTKILDNPKKRQKLEKLLLEMEKIFAEE